MEKIITDRLILRNFSLADAKGLLGYLSNPRVNCFRGEKITTHEEAISEAKKKSEDDSHIAVLLKDDESLIGELFYLYEEPDTYSIGWNFNEQYEGKGYASESAKALFKCLFNEKSARRLYAYVEDDNYRSQKLCEKLGMRKEGCFLEFISFIKDENGIPKYENTFQYALLKKEWEKQQI
ncbi:GCN5 family acetyltransferase [Clostridium beijerinckii]|uniref:GCN5 family acetyltransferase n=1 Tax=Clostridium beijerinckii TaxID=1520 RepID=A0A0B5QUL9_CLOBE|nr:GNAT family N-acetyltransferase [Clostridium beijerinckii]AJH00604.1 GCN5 family acetyltransferase [Clostridium beijerinckii]OCA98629.1 GCN5 family acetyltransferase [Clostridium beijerinckii]